MAGKLVFLLKNLITQAATFTKASATVRKSFHPSPTGREMG